MAQPSAERLALLYRTSQTINSSLDLDTVLTRVMDEVIAATHAERGFLMLRDSQGHLVFRAARGIDHQTIDAPAFQISRSVVERVAREGEPTFTSDAQTDAWLGGRASVAGLGLRSILCVPLKLKDAILGVIYVDNRLQAGIFSSDDLEFLTAIATSAAIAIENARLFSDAQSKLSSLRLLHDVGTDLTSTLDLNQILTHCLQRVQDLLGARTASILTLEGDELVFQIALGEKADEVKPFRVKVGQGIAGWVAQNARGTFTNDVHNDARFYHTIDDGTGYDTRALMAAPLIVNNRVIGVIEITNKPGGFTDADLDLLSTIAASAAIAIENARLYKVAVEKGRMERELQVAHQVQASLIPAKTPQLDGWEFATYWSPARVVGGDYYDFFTVQTNSHPAQQGIVIADVSDKGMPSALFMALTRSTIRASAARAASPAECITQANRLISADAMNGMFVTLFYAQLDSVTGALTYVNAGHNPPLHYRAARNEFVELARTGIVLGFDAQSRYAQAAVQLDPGDFLVLYTDGIPETTNAQEEQFGMERFLRVFGDHCNMPMKDAIIAVEKTLCAFTENVAPSDDVTLVIIKRL